MTPRMLPELFQALMDDCRNTLDESASPRVYGERLFSSAAAQFELDEQLEVVQRVVADVTTYAGEMTYRLRSRRNQLSAINRLPTDVLLIIFQRAKDLITQETSFPRHRGALKFSQVLLRLSSVCRLWRNFITQDCPALWTKPPMTSPMLAMLFLSRSKEAPLEIAFDGDHKLSERLSLLRPHINRCRSLQIFVHDDDNAQKVVELLQGFPSAAHLESLYLRQGDFRDDTMGRTRSTSSLSGLFAGATPRLRKIHLRAICIPLDTPVFHGLTHLDLSYIDYSDGGSIHKFFHTLELSPFLGVLRLIYVVLPPFIADIQPTPVLPTIVLTHLRSLFLRCRPGDQVRLILHQLAIPPSCRLDICGETGMPGDDLYGFLPPPSVISANTLPLMQPIRLLCVEMDDDYIQLRGCTLGLQDQAYSITQNGEGISQRVLPNLGHILPLVSLEELDLTVCTTEDSPDLFLQLADFLQRHPSIKDIVCNDPRVLELLVVTPTRHLCPLLHSLKFCFESAPCEAAMIRLVDSRTMRGDGGNNALRHVMVWECASLSDSGLAALRERVEVEVD